MIDTVLYLIRHKATGEIMPSYRGGRGYSHWNPNSTVVVAAEVTGWRLLKDAKQANKIIKIWSTQPNIYRNYDNNSEKETLQIRNDGRKEEDLEVVAVEVKEILRSHQ